MIQATPEQEEMLRSAIERNDTDVIAQLLETGDVVPNTMTAYNNLPILAGAIRADADDVAILLMNAGADTDFPASLLMPYRDNALSLAIAYNRERVVVDILANRPGAIRPEAINRAVIYRRMSILQMLLAAGVKPMYDDLQTAMSMNPLDETYVRLLVEHGARLASGQLAHYLMYHTRPVIPQVIEEIPDINGARSRLPAEWISTLLDIDVGDINSLFGSHTVLSTLCYYRYPTWLLAKALDKGARVTAVAIEHAIMCGPVYMDATATGSNVRLLLDRAEDLEEAMNSAMRIVDSIRDDEHAVQIRTVKRMRAHRIFQMLYLLDHSPLDATAQVAMAPVAQLLYRVPVIAMMVGTAISGIEGSLVHQMDCLREEGRCDRLS